MHYVVTAIITIEVNVIDKYERVRNSISMSILIPPAPVFGLIFRG
jgi:hypothetical protein